jgi:IS30 family transposase
MIENANGILRRDMPRKNDISGYSDEDVQAIHFLINSTPKKCLGFKPPAYAFLQPPTGALEM